MSDHVTDDEHFDNPQVLLDAATLIDIRDATPTRKLGRGSRAYLAAQRERLELLQREGFVTRVGPVAQRCSGGARWNTA
jgi:hypothetical protein